MISTELKALRAKYKALCAEHVKLQHRYECDKRDWKQLHDDTLDCHDAEIEALRAKYEALRAKLVVNQINLHKAVTDMYFNCLEGHT